MFFINDERRAAMFSGEYICPRCGERMEYEDANEDSLVCSSCGHSMDIDRYGFTDEEYEDLMDSILDDGDDF